MKRKSEGETGEQQCCQWAENQAAKLSRHKKIP
jgi:hypothetical protein